MITVAVCFLSAGTTKGARAVMLDMDRINAVSMRAEVDREGDDKRACWLRYSAAEVIGDFTALKRDQMEILGTMRA